MSLSHKPNSRIKRQPKHVHYMDDPVIPGGLEAGILPDEDFEQMLKDDLHHVKRRMFYLNTWAETKELMFEIKSVPEMANTEPLGTVTNAAMRCNRRANELEERLHEISDDAFSPTDQTVIRNLEYRIQSAKNAASQEYLDFSGGDCVKS